MTRGRLVFITNTVVYESCEFNGGMMSDGGYGEDIIKDYKEGEIVDVDSFVTYLGRFNAKYFGYSEEELYRVYNSENYTPTDTLEKYADYSYIINASEQTYKEEGLYPNQLCVYKYKNKQPKESYPLPTETNLSEEQAKKEYLKGVLLNAIKLSGLKYREIKTILNEIKKNYK